MHIVKHYKDLADVTLFSQCRTADHPNILELEQYASTNSFRAVVESQANGFLTCDESDETQCGWGHVNWPAGKWRRAFELGEIAPSNLTIKEFITAYLFDTLPEAGKCISLLYGTFSVTKNLVHKRPVEFYSQLLDVVSRHQQPEEIHYLERLWAYVFLPLEAMDGRSSTQRLTD